MIMDTAVAKLSLRLSPTASLPPYASRRTRFRVLPTFPCPPQYANYCSLRFSVLPSQLPCTCHMSWGSSAKRRYTISQGQFDLDSEDSDEGKSAAENSLTTSPSLDGSKPDGKAGFVSFFSRQQTPEDKAKPEIRKQFSSFLWFAGPSILVASFILPTLYLRRIFSVIFEDSLLTDFLILFLTEALFYCGTAIFLLIIHHLNRHEKPAYKQPSSNNLSQRISSVATLVLSLMVPMIAMGFVWPWTGPAASATLSPYLVGVVVQFAFERYASRKKSPCLPVIPIIFKVYRLHQLNRAAQLVTALSFAVKEAEVTLHNLEISNSLGTLMNVLQFLGVILIWSLASYLMKFVPATARQSN